MTGLFLVILVNTKCLQTRFTTSINEGPRRSQCPRDLRRRSAAALLLSLCVRIPPGTFTLSVVSFVWVVR